MPILLLASLADPGSPLVGPNVDNCFFDVPGQPRTNPTGTRPTPHEFRYRSYSPEEAAENIARAREKRERRKARNLRNRKEPTP